MSINLWELPLPGRGALGEQDTSSRLRIISKDWRWSLHCLLCFFINGLKHFIIEKSKIEIKEKLPSTLLKISGCLALRWFLRLVAEILIISILQALHFFPVTCLSCFGLKIMIGRNSSCTAETLILTLTAELPPGGGSAESAICKQSLYDNKEWCVDVVYCA